MAMSLPPNEVAAAKAGILVLYAFGILFGLAVYKLVLFPFFVSPLRRIPAPHWSCRISGAWAQKRSQDWGVETALFWEDVHKRLGGVVVVGPREVRVGGMYAADVLDEAGLDKGEWYKVYENYGVSNILADIDPHKNAAHRERMRRVYSTRFLLTASPFPAQATSILGNRLKSYLRCASLSAQPMDALRFSQALSIDMLMAYIYGMRHGTHELMYDKKEPSVFGKDGLTMAKPRAQLEDWNMRVCEEVCAAYAREKPARSEDVPTVFLATGEQVHDSSTTNETWERDFSAWCAAAEKQYDFPALQEDANDAVKRAIASETLAHITAGHEPVAVTLAYAMFHISSTPSIQQRVHLEVRRAGFSHSTPPRLEAVDACPLLRAALKETLRLHPALPGLLVRKTPARGSDNVDGVGVAGYKVPHGTAVSAAVAAVHHARDAFVQSGVWMPERWGAPSEDMDDCFVPFGSGPRSCVGDEFAFIVLSYSLAMILGSFSISLVDSTTFIPRYWQHTMGFDSKAALLIKVEQREGET